MNPDNVEVASDGTKTPDEVIQNRTHKIVPGEQITDEDCDEAVTNGHEERPTLEGGALGSEEVSPKSEKRKKRKRS